MADRRSNNRIRRRYRTEGNAALQPEVEQEPARSPSRREQIRGNTVRRPEPVRVPRTVPRKRPVPRPDVQVRTQSAFSPFAVVGLFSVLACTLLLVISTAQLATVNHEIVDLRSDLAGLKDESLMLQAKYELVFDLEAIEKMFLSNGSMVRAGAGQTVYLDLSAPDSVIYYDGAGEGLSALLQRLEQGFADFLS